MDFFYPNWINDFWRIQGVIHFGDKGYFELNSDSLHGGYDDDRQVGKALKRFDREKIMAFCEERGIALFDTARKVRRLKDNADDNFLEIVEGSDVFGLLEQMPECRTIVTTGGKASEELQAYLESRGLRVQIPKLGECIRFSADGTGGLAEGWFCWWRMPSTSRAYPMKLEKKAAYYRRLFE